MSRSSFQPVSRLLPRDWHHFLMRLLAFFFFWVHHTHRLHHYHSNKLHQSNKMIAILIFCCLTGNANYLFSYMHLFSSSNSFLFLQVFLWGSTSTSFPRISSATPVTTFSFSAHTTSHRTESYSGTRRLLETRLWTSSDMDTDRSATTAWRKRSGNILG